MCFDRSAARHAAAVRSAAFAVLRRRLAAHCCRLLAACKGGADDASGLRRPMAPGCDLRRCAALPGCRPDVLRL